MAKKLVNNTTIILLYGKTRISRNIYPIKAVEGNFISGKNIFFQKQGKITSAMIKKMVIWQSGMRL